MEWNHYGAVVWASLWSKCLEMLGTWSWGRCLESLWSRCFESGVSDWNHSGAGVGIWSHPGTNVWSYSGAGVGVWNHYGAVVWLLSGASG